MMWFSMKRWNNSAAQYCTSGRSPKCWQSSNRKTTGLFVLKQPSVSSCSFLVTAASFFDASSLRESCSSSRLRPFLLSLKIGSGGNASLSEQNVSSLSPPLTTNLNLSLPLPTKPQNKPERERERERVVGHKHRNWTVIRCVLQSMTETRERQTC